MKQIVFLMGVALAGGMICTCSPGDGRGLAAWKSGLEINVPGDFSSIQQAIDAASAGDVILVGPGDYIENPYPKAGIHIKGAGPDQTILHRQIRFWGEEGCTLSGFRVVKTGATGLDADAGIIVDANDTLAQNNLVEGFGIGIWVVDIQRGRIDANVARQNHVGMELVKRGTEAG